MISVEIFKITEEVEKQIPKDINDFQTWIDNLDPGQFVDYYILCKKDDCSVEENTYLLNTALVIFFRECDIDTMPLVPELMTQLLGEFKSAVIKVGMEKSGKIKIDRPIRLEREMIPNGGVKTFVI